MKKKLYFLSMLAAGLTLAGCNDDLGDGPGNPDQQIGNAYVKVTLNLPTATGATTRAVNDVYADGESNEYAVKKAALIFFTGTSETDATATGVENLEEGSWNNDLDNDAITSFKEFVVEVKKPESGKKLFALAVLNATVEWNNTNATINGKTISTLKDLMTEDDNASLSTYASGTNGFLMLNAPLANTIAANTPGATISAGDLTTLVELTIFDDANDAATLPADEIYVERAVAKVTVAKGSKWTEETDGSYSMTVDNGGAYANDKAILKGWYLNITNKTTKLGHDIYGLTGDALGTEYVKWAGYANATSFNNNQRFYSATNPRRAYWGIDCNYVKSYSGDGFLTQAELDFNIVSTSTTYDQISADLKPSGGFLYGQDGENDEPIYPAVYCFENTMDFDKQAQIQTTGIVFVMQYMFDPDREAQTFFTLPTADKVESTLPIYTMATVAEESTGLADKANELLGQDAGFKVALKAGAGSLSSGYYRGADGMMQIFTKDTQEALSPEEALQLYNVVGDVALYQNGTTYYYASRIQHFGDEYCYIDPANVELDDYQESHLGRYGVLRNNWYEIDVTGISGPGSPVPPVPTDPGDPDDDKTGYIKANINILSWAKRSQNVDL